MNFKIKEEVKLVLDHLSNNGFESYVVGGCVRDKLLNKKPKDWDVTTSAKPENIIKLFRNFSVVPTGLKHGTVTVIINKYNIEITTYRIDGEYIDNRRPENIKFTASLKEDLSRRDFTINAMAYNEEQGLVDFFGGQRDLNRRLIKCVGDSYKRFSEDALRMMRAVRFSCQLNFDLDETIFSGIEKLINNLDYISKERIRDEFFKALDSNNPEKIILFYKTKIIKYVFPEMFILIDENKLKIALRAINSIVDIKDKVYLKLTLFFIEIINNKEQIKSIPIDRILKKLKLDNITIKYTVILLENSFLNINEDKICIKKILNKIGDDLFCDLLIIKEAIFTLKTDINKSEKIEIFERIKMVYNDIKNNKECYNKSCLNINGKDLMDLGIKEGKEIGIIIDKLVDYIIYNPKKNNKKSLAEYIKNANYN
ncbi:MAG: CCA tRNA nucleotidyltransferase [Clostridiales bacterium]